MSNDELLGAIASPSRYRPRLLLRWALPVAGLGLVWTVLVVGVVFALVALERSLAPRVGQASLAITGAVAISAAAIGLLVARRRSAAAQPDIPLDMELFNQYPLECVALSVVAGVLASSVDGASLTRPLLDAFIRARR